MPQKVRGPSWKKYRLSGAEMLWGSHETGQILGLAAGKVLSQILNTQGGKKTLKN